MNDVHLDELLERKKNVSMKFDQCEEDFIEEFFTRTAQAPVHHFPVWRIAAGFLLLLSIAAGLYSLFPANHCGTAAGAKLGSAENNAQVGKLEEAVRIFGGDAALIFFGDELITGKRESKVIPDNRIDLQLHAGNRIIDLSLACPDSDTFYLDADGISGNVVVSRSDNSTLVLDIDLTINGTALRTVVPVSRISGKHYKAGVLS